ncbi:MAG: TGS domain-containing protein, partial [archaeon]|nr:TGS domain-containing protein [archaeon]
TKKFPEEKWKFLEKKKSVYSIHAKMLAQNKQVSQLSDTLILKILVPNDSDCYSAMGKVHSVFKPIPFKIKDFIAIPEHGIYRSLHIQIIGPDKKSLKAYIFTEEMEEISQDGILYYLRNEKKFRKKLSEISKSFSRIGEPGAKDSKELAGSMNLDFHNSTMIVFTTSGKVVELPLGSTALDFAFFTDEKKAKRASGAQINDQIKPLWTKLNTGDRIKILYSLTNHVGSNWLSFVNSRKAKSIIKKQIGKSKGPKSAQEFIKFTIQSVDRPKLLMELTKIMATNGLDMETTVCKMNDDKTTCVTEFYAREAGPANTQKALKQIQEMKETLNVTLSYF